MNLCKIIAMLLILLLLVLFLTFLFIHLFGFLPILPPDGNPTMDKPTNIHLTYQNDPAYNITVIWQTDTSTTGDIVLYDTVPRGGNSSLYSYSANGSHHTYTGLSGYIHEVELTNLNANTTYYFICGGPGNYSAERSFKTAPNSTSDFQFVAGGDSRSDPAMRVLVSQAMSHTNPSFVMHCGDLVSDGRIQSLWDTWFTDVNDNWIGDDGLTIPVIPSLGNHEQNATNYYEQFALPGNEQWYYIDWGPTLRIIVLNSESQISEQAVWLENVLNSTSQDAWKIVMFHRNVYFSGWHDNNTDIQQYWVPLFDEYHVDIVIQGHTHHYHRTLPMYNNTVASSYQNDTMYLTSGAWGAPLHPYENQSYSAYGNSTYHFTLINVFKNDTLHLEAKDIDGYTFDQVWLNKTVQNSKSSNETDLKTMNENPSQNTFLATNHLIPLLETPLEPLLSQKSYTRTILDFSAPNIFRTYPSFVSFEKSLQKK